MSVLVTDGNLSFANPQIVIALQFNSSVPGSALNLNDIELSNTLSFDTDCTFVNLSITIQNPTNSIQQNLILSLPDSNNIVTVISESSTPCLANTLSTFLTLPTDFVPGSPLLESMITLRVISDITSPSISSSGVVVNLNQGSISILFSDLVDLITIDASLLRLYGSAIVGSFPFVAFAALTNSNSIAGISNTYAFSLEVFELQTIENVCSSICYLHISPGDLVSDVFGNILSTQNITILPTNFTSFTSSQFVASFVPQLVTPTRVNITISPPAQREGDVIYYLLYEFPQFVNYYHSNCDYPLAYEYQRRSNTTQWNIGLPSGGNFPPCINGSDYRCYASKDLNFIIEFFSGYLTSFILATEFPLITFNSPSMSLSPVTIYANFLQFQIFVQPTPRRRSLQQSPNAVGNRIVVRWQVDSSFCDRHQLTLYYGEVSFPSPSFKYINLDTNITCGTQFVNLYSTTGTISVIPEIRILAAHVNIPLDTCIAVRLGSLNQGGIPSFRIDRPVIDRVSGLSPSNSIALTWDTFTPSPGYTIDYFNIYIIPVYALRYDGGSCSNVDSQTTPNDFTFLPTEYYKYGVSIPSEDFPFNCPPLPGLAFPYDCYSLSSDNTNLIFSHSFPYAISIIVEAVTRELTSNAVVKVRSYPQNFTSYTLNIGRDGLNFQQYTWNRLLCQVTDSFLFIHLSFFDEEIDGDVFLSEVFPCPPGMGIDLQVQNSFSYKSFSNYFSEVTTLDGLTCLLSYESSQINVFASFSEITVELIDFSYIDYETILVSIQIFDFDSSSTNIYTIPDFEKILNIDVSATDICPGNTPDLPPYFINFRSNSTLRNMNNLNCENTSDYTCTTVQNIINIPLRIIPGLGFIIRVVFRGSEYTISPNNQGPFYIFSNAELIRLQSELNTNTTLATANSIMVSWNVDYYCPPNSYISVAWKMSFSEDLIPDQRRRRGLSLIEIDATMPCDVGFYVISDLAFNSEYMIDGYVFFNSTTLSFSQTCPVILIEFSNRFSTSPILTGIQLLDLSTILVFWNSIPGIESPYTLLAYPSALGTFNESITTQFTPTTANMQTITFINPQLITTYFEMCLNSSPAITCSKATTANTSAVISIIPGYEYILALAFQVGTQIPIRILENRYNPMDLLVSEVSISGFNNSYSYNLNTAICTPGVSIVLYYNEINSNGRVFAVYPCTQNSGTLFVTIFAQLPQPRFLFAFPYVNIIIPGLNLMPPAATGVILNPPLSFLPISAAPVITSVFIPSDITSDLFQVSWTSPPNIPIPQQFDSFILYAYPESQVYLQGSFSCPTNITSMDELQDFTIPIQLPEFVDPSNDTCPPPPGQLYFCKEFTTNSVQLPLIALLDYRFVVVARYNGGLLTHAFEYSSSTQASENLSPALNLAYQVTPASITVNWYSQVSFCANARFFFILDSSFIPSYVACTAGSYTIDSLQPLTTYELEYILFYDPSSLLPDSGICIANSTQLAFDPLPVTTSFCTPVNPCGSVGVCSEGFLNSSFHCDCNTGYMFDANTCVDVNECFAVPSVCVNAACLNSVGNFSCTCFEGYTPMGASTTVCEDIDECEIAGNCVNGNCTNLLSPENYRCDCSSDFEGISCTIPIDSPTCPSITETTLLSDNNITFPVTEYGVVVTVSCSQLDTELFGSITRLCGDTGDWGTVNIDDCQRIIFVAIEQTTTLSQTRTLTPVETVTLSDDLATATEVSLFPGEISVASVGVVAIAEALSNLTGDELRESLSSVQGNIVETGSNILRRENSAAFASATPSEAQSYVNNLVDGIQDIGILIGSVAEDNATIVLEISEPTVALIVTVVRNVTEPLVLGSNLSMSVGSNASAVMAAQTSVSIPASVFQENDDGNGIAVSVALFSTVQELISEVVVNTSEQEANRVRDSLASSLASVSLFTRSGQRISQLAEPISIRFVVNSSLIVENSQETTEIRCASSRLLSDGWSFLYVDLANPGDVPPDPANCLASHLTHFGVLVSVTSLDLSEAERLALQILTYLTCGISIIFLLLSIAAYAILWWKTRKQQENIFSKDATILHLNFAVSLLLALVFFLISDAAYGNEGLCKAVILFQYYFWLSVFTASLSIGIYLLIKIFAWSSQRRFWHYLVLLSWGLPIPLLIITPSITFNYIINTKEMVCWFSKEPRYANLGFIVPMLAITLTNFVILIITAIVLFRISKGKKGMVSQIRGVLIASFILAPILGLPWLFSIITTAPTSAVAFIFTIILGLQGTLFAILYPLRTPDIIDYVLRCRNPYTSVKMTYTPSSNPTHPTPTAIKFRVKRADHSTAGDSASIVKSKAEHSEHGHENVELDNIKPVTVSVSTSEKEEGISSLPFITGKASLLRYESLDNN